MPTDREDTRPLIEPASRAEWREWLQRSHADVTGIWLAVGKKGNQVTTLTYDDAVEEALCFGWIDSVVHKLDDDRFRQLFTPRKPRSTWSLLNKQRVERLIAAGQMTPAGMAAIEVAKANGSWESLDHVDAMTMPDDLSQALAAVTGASEGFSALSASRQRQALYWIGTAKRDETRRSRVEKVVSAAAEGRSAV